MSSQIASPAVIATIAAYLADIKEDKQALGLRLLALNVVAFKARYEDRHAEAYEGVEGEYDHAATMRPVMPPQLLRNLEYLQYQLDEGEFEGEDAALKERIGSAIAALARHRDAPAYESTSWG